MESTPPFELSAEFGSWMDSEPSRVPQSTSEDSLELWPPLFSAWLDEPINSYWYPPTLAEGTDASGCELQAAPICSIERDPPDNSHFGFEFDFSSYPTDLFSSFEQPEAGSPDHLGTALDTYLAEAQISNALGESSSSMPLDIVSIPAANPLKSARRSRRLRKHVSGSDHYQTTGIDGVNGNSRRSFISPSVKSILQEHFKFDAYPQESEVISLAEKTGLTASSIRSWFTNTRSRVENVESFSSRESRRVQIDIYDTRNEAERVQFAANISAANLATLNLLCTASSTPLDEYLKSNPDEDVNSTVAMLAAVSEKSFTRENTPMFPGTPISSSHFRPSSVVGSESSTGSVHSSQSHISLDSRGSRRGRKRWRCAGVPKQAGSTTKYSSKSSSEPRRASIQPFLTSTHAKRRRKTPPAKYICTWLDCYTTFRNRSEWVRHEEAVHYCPYRWVCCAGTSMRRVTDSCFICGKADISLEHYSEAHFTSCALKELADRTFLREDQLAQHILGVHLNQPSHIRKTDKKGVQYKVPKNLLSAWKSENVSFNHAHLRCGFCGTRFANWSERQDHVFEHVKSNVCKDAWWPDRLPVRAVRNLPVYMSWSCRYLHDWHHTFQTIRHSSEDDVLFKCKLCDFKFSVIGARNDAQLKILEDHAKLHTLRNCGQELFLSSDDFITHMRKDHAAGTYGSLLQAWVCIQRMGPKNESFTTDMVRESVETELCDSLRCSSSFQN